MFNPNMCAIVKPWNEWEFGAFTYMTQAYAKSNRLNLPIQKKMSFMSFYNMHNKRYANYKLELIIN